MKTRNLSFGIIVSIVMISILFSGCCGLCQDPPPDPDDNWKPLNTTNNATQNNNITPPTNLTANNVTNQSININQTNQNSTYQNITFNGKNWTIMVYMDADNNLEGDGFKDLNEMEIAGSTDDVNIIVQMDRTEGWDTSNGDWTGAKRIYVEQDSSSQFRSKIIEDMGEVNMGDPYTLSSFIQWTTKNYPAENYMLILWDHGAGHEGLCWDNDNYDDYLELSELKSALQDGGTQFEVIGFDACLMSTLEIASIIDDHGQIMVASQESEPMDGWEYSSFLNKLKNNPDITSKQLSIEIINGFYNHYYLNPNARDITLSAVNLSMIEDLVITYSDFRNEYNLQASDTIADASYYTHKYGGSSKNSYMLGDLAQFMYIISSLSSNQMQTEAEEISQMTKDAIIYEVHGPASKASRGISTYLPDVITDQNIEYSEQAYAIADYVEYSENVMEDMEPPKVEITNYDDYFELYDTAVTEATVSGDNLGEVYFLIAKEIDDEIIIVNMDPLMLEPKELDDDTTIAEWEDENEFYFEWDGSAVSITDYIDHVPVLAIPMDYGSDIYIVEGEVTNDYGQYEATLLFDRGELYSIQLYENYDGEYVPFEYEPKGYDYFSPYIYVADENGDLEYYIYDDVIFFLTDDIYLDYYYLPEGNYYTGFAAENVIGEMEIDINEVTFVNEEEEDEEEAEQPQGGLAYYDG